MISTTKFASAITPVHRKYFTQEYYATVSKQYEQLVKVETMGKPSESKQHFGGFGLPQANTEGNTIHVDTMSEGEEASYTSVRYDQGYYITHEMMNFDLSGVWGGAGQMGKTKVDNAPQRLGKGFAQLEEIEVAKLFTDGFSNTGYDGKATFASDHPLADSSDTASNLATGALTPDNVKLAITQMRTATVDEAGLLSVVKPKKLVVPPALEFTANEIMRSEKQAYEMSNTTNSISEMDVFVADFLAKTTGTYKNTNWFLWSDDVENLILGWLERPWFDTQVVPQKVDLFCFGYAHFATACVNWRGLVGSTGQ